MIPTDFASIQSESFGFAGGSHDPHTGLVRFGARDYEYHIPIFILCGYLPISFYDRRIVPNDFRNMFLLAALIYAMSTLLIIGLHRSKLSPRLRLTMAPVLIILWLIIGSDGTTAKAGQILYVYENPQTTPRSLRHGLMLEWHRICDDLLGDVR